MPNSLDELDIFIITYNRANKLNNTLSQILDDASPIKDNLIHIFDNNSDDNTKEIVQKYQSNHPNLVYSKNKYNIGGNANIVKAFYKASKKYVWILCDNDYYCWDNWKEVEEEIKKETDAIIVSTYENPKYDIAQLLIQTTFVSGVIYKTSNIDDTVMGNMEFNISNLFPHLALSTKLINEKKKLHILSKPIVTSGNNKDENGSYVYTRGYNGSVHPLQKNMNWLAGYANSLHMIKDKKIRNYIIRNNKSCSELNSAKIFFAKHKEAGNNLYDLLCVFAILSLTDKIKFLINTIFYFTLYRIIFLYKEEYFNLKEGILIKQYSIRLFYFIKAKLFKISKKIKGAE